MASVVSILCVLLLPFMVPDVQGLGQANDDPLDFGYVVVCYYSVVEAWYRRSRAMYHTKDVDTHLCTHINYDNAILDPETLTIVSKDSWADIDNHLYENVTRLRLENPTLKIMLVLGGYQEPSEKYSRLVNDPVARSRFAIEAVKYLKKYEFDGLDFAWFYPGCWDAGRQCSESNPNDKRNFVQLIRELRVGFDTLRSLLELLFNRKHSIRRRTRGCSCRFRSALTP